MAGILVYALHDDEGNFNKNSLGAISEAAKLAGELGGEAAAVVVGDVADDACASLGNWGAAKVYRAKDVPEGLAQPIVDAMAKVITENGFGKRTPSDRPPIEIPMSLRKPVSPNGSARGSANGAGKALPGVQPDPNAPAPPTASGAFGPSQPHGAPYGGYPPPADPPYDKPGP